MEYSNIGGKNIIFRAYNVLNLLFSTCSRLIAARFFNEDIVLDVPIFSMCVSDS